MEVIKCQQHVCFNDQYSKNRSDRHFPKPQRNSRSKSIPVRVSNFQIQTICFAESRLYLCRFFRFATTNYQIQIPGNASSPRKCKHFDKQRTTHFNLAKKVTCSRCLWFCWSSYCTRIQLPFVEDSVSVELLSIIVCGVGN